MIDKLTVLDIIQTALEGTDKFLVDLKITPDNRIYVSIDGDNGIMIDDCVELSHTIEDHMDRDVEDFELNVASAGLDSPLRNVRQYIKNIGQPLNVTLLTGDKYEGKLASADNDHFCITLPESKRFPARNIAFSYKDVKAAKIVINF
jgi:ribosome maturation factor RimP